MSSKADPVLVKSSPAQQNDQQNDRKKITNKMKTSTTKRVATTTSSSDDITNSSSMLQATRRRRDSSEDFDASGGSLGSIGGSAVGFGSDRGGVGNNNNNSKTQPSPSGRRPFRKRKASVDFLFPALSVNDNDSSYSITNRQLLPQHHHVAPVISTATEAMKTAEGTSLLSSPLGAVLPSSSARSRLYSDLTTNESLTASTNSLMQLHNNKRNRNRKNTHKLDKEPVLASMDALPCMEDLLPPIDNDSSSILLHPPESLGSGDNTITNQSKMSNRTLRKDLTSSIASSIKTEGHGIDRLDSLCVEAGLSASRIRKGSSVTLEKNNSNKSHEASENSSTNNSCDGTLGSQSHRFLMEAFLGDGTESLVLNPSQRERLGSFDATATNTGKIHNNNNNISSNINNSGNILISRERLSSIGGGRRDRLESWGGMSDLSLGMKDQNLDSLVYGNSTATNGAGGAIAPDKTTSALAATICTSLANDITAAVHDGHESVSSFLVNDEIIPTRIAVKRDRLNSIASIATDQSALDRITRLNVSSAIDSEFPSDVHSFVKAAMESVEDQLADLATAVEAVSHDNQGDQDSEISSTVSPMIGAASDVGSNKSDSVTGRPRSSSISSLLQIAVDYNAVAAAVDAAEAASGALYLTNLTPNNSELSSGTASVVLPSSSSVGSHPKLSRKRPLPLPLQKNKFRVNDANNDNSKSYKSHTSSLEEQGNRLKKRPCSSSEQLFPNSKRNCVDISKAKSDSTLELKVSLNSVSKVDDRDMEKIRARARAAAGYVPPSGFSPKLISLPPKKRNSTPATPLAAPRPSMVTSNSNFKTPIMSNTFSSKNNNSSTPHTSHIRGTPTSSIKGQSSQKWESMFECLVKFIEERKNEGTVGMTDEEKKEWIWDGNVPTTFKAKDGKALGRWVNNQRSAKSKGSLKDEREKRLVNAGLKWSVLASNSWNEMLEELRIYVADQIRQGKNWDGNVPTNYRIKISKEKAKSFIKDDDEDKNLGRWVNRQRSMFQAGKLRKDRRASLEKIGLKWSMLATTSWESMFETLCLYVEEKKKGEAASWDGNVPANFRTEDIPPRALGRWINRQRSAYGKNKLKPEYVAKLNEIGLKWSIHERRPTYTTQYTSRPDTVASSTTDTVAAKSTTVDELLLPLSTSRPDAVTSSTTATMAAKSTTVDELLPLSTSRPDAVESSTTATVAAKSTTADVLRPSSTSRPDAVTSSMATKVAKINTVRELQASSTQIEHIDSMTSGAKVGKIDCIIVATCAKNDSNASDKENTAKSIEDSENDDNKAKGVSLPTSTIVTTDSLKLETDHLQHKGLEQNFDISSIDGPIKPKAESSTTKERSFAVEKNEKTVSIDIRNEPSTVNEENLETDTSKNFCDTHAASCTLNVPVASKPPDDFISKSGIVFKNYPDSTIATQNPVDCIEQDQAVVVDSSTVRN